MPRSIHEPTRKLEVARQMERLGMDVIEAGFPCISDGDFEAVHTIAREIKKCRIAGLARCVKADIEAAARALEPAGERARHPHLPGNQQSCTCSSN